MKQLRLLMLILLMIGGMSVIQAQEDNGDWKWARCYRGMDAGGYQANRVQRALFDEEGNLYIYGLFGENADWELADGVYEDIAPTGSDGTNETGAILAKLDTAGNLVWQKIVRSKEYMSRVNWMERHDSLLYISGVYELAMWPQHTWSYYMDTLIQKDKYDTIFQKPPFKRGHYTYFATIDLDGNLQSSVFLNYSERDKTPNSESPCTIGLCFRNSLLPFHVDSAGNIYILNEFGYWGEAENPCVLHVYMDDTVKHTNFYLRGSGNSIIRWYLMKFSPEWDLLWNKPIVSHTEGVGFPPDCEDLTEPPLIEKCYGFEMDEDNNIYLTGKIVPLANSGLAGHAELNDYPCYVYFDNTHYIEYRSENETYGNMFLLKLDSTGTPVWSQYSSVSNPTEVRDRYTTEMESFGLDVEGDKVFVPIRYHVSSPEDTLYIGGHGLSDSASNATGHPGVVAMMCFDKETGLCEWSASHRIHAHMMDEFQSDFAYQGHVFLLGGWRNGTRTHAQIEHYSADGYYINTIEPVAKAQNHSSVMINPRGELLLTQSVVNQRETIFGEDTLLTDGNSNAVMAVYYDESFAEPLVREAQEIAWEQELRVPLSAGTVNLTGTATSGLPVSYRCDDDYVAMAFDDVLYLRHSGTAMVTAMQTGNISFMPATPITLPLEVYGGNGVEDCEQESLLVYPNPAHGEVHIMGEGIKEVSVYNAVGVLVATYQDSSTLDISPLTAGLYTLKITTARGVTVKKLVVR